MSDDFRAGMFRPLQYISKLAISEENIRLLVVCISILGKVYNESHLKRFYQFFSDKYRLLFCRSENLGLISYALS